MRLELLLRSIFARRVHRATADFRLTRIDGCEHNISLEQTAREIACDFAEVGDPFRWPSHRDDYLPHKATIQSFWVDGCLGAGTRGRLLSSFVMLPVPWYQPRQGINFKRVSASAAMTVSEKS